MGSRRAAPVYSSRSVTSRDKKLVYLLQIETNGWAPRVCLNL